ncbi:MAG: DUF4258 domain-containing protein [Planctomycetota bacterium]|nr:DUF4258 domain-containing protein [Planctomycetota bacterium]
MKIRYYLDEDSGLPHVRGHGVSEAEVEAIIARPMEDRPGSEGSRVALGRTKAGRYLRVVYVPDSEPGSFFVVTAFELAGKPLKALKRRMKKRAR